MKRRILVTFLVVLALLALVGIDTFRQYRAKPFFAGGFGVYGRGIIPRANWERRYGIGLDGDLHARYDYRERVLLVVRVPNRSVEWLVDDQLLGKTLRIRRQDDDLVKEIEWRRDCIIYVDREGVPTYTSISVHEFDQAFSSSTTIVPGLNAIVKKGLNQIGK